MNSEDEGYECNHCTRWIPDTGNWFCEECDTATCERCGKFDHVEKVFLCPDCFSKEKE